MKQLELTNLALADLLHQLALLLRAGVQLGEGLILLSEEEKDPDYKALMTAMAQRKAALLLHGAYPTKEYA